jgi:hypothetical protein
MSGIHLSAPVVAPPLKARLEIIWADKAAMYIAIGWATFLLIAWLIAIVGCGCAGAWLLAKDTAVLALEAGSVLVLTVWFALTGVDLLFRGPARRKARSK